MQEVFAEGHWLVLIFAFLMGLSMFIYAVLDGYDLGVGMLIKNAHTHEKDRMIASIGPFWDANETWLVLGVGLLLVAFPAAHGIILGELYMPVTVMIFGLIFRGVAFDFRAKVPFEQKWRWNSAFFYGSLITALAQGYMLGSYVIGFKTGWSATLFCCLIAVSVASAYCLIGACWLIMKCEGTLQAKSVKWAKYHLINSIVGLASVTVATPLLNQHIFEKWFSFPVILGLAPIPIITILLVIALIMLLNHMPFAKDKYCWLPFVITVAIFILSFIGLAYSFLPDIIPNKMTIFQAASSPESLMVILYGALIVIPMLIGYTALSYYIFRGKATDLSYD